MSLDIERLEQSFAQVRDRDQEFAATFYRTLFTDYPEAESLFQSTDMEEQGKKLFKSLVLVVESLRKPDILTSSLKGLGLRHLSYGVLPHHYAMVGQALLKTFDQLLGTEWTPPVERAWATAYQSVSQLMLEGTNDSSPSSEHP